MINEIQTFEGVTPAKWEKIKGALFAEYRIPMTALRATVSNDRYTFDYCYDPVERTVSVQLLAKPWYAAESIVNQRIHDLCEAAL
jgi:hypothetical protein